MFSALKRMTGRGAGEGGQPNVGNGSTSTPPGLTAMSVSLQKRLVSKGVHYNMKIILKGDRNVGKTQLFRRLQAQPFVEEYTATEEIQVANIMWNYKTSDDIVKVEVWDVVDVANKKKRLVSDKLKIENSNSEENVAEYGLDANTIDVYKNTNGVIFVFDITKTWYVGGEKTFEYVKREVENVPDHIPVLILGNRRDMGHHRAVQSDTVIFFIENLEREGCGVVRYAESSMRNGFGLKFVHKFFNLPYLQLQRAALLKQLETNGSETEICHQELDLYAESDEANYDLFIDGLAQKRRQIADALAPPKLSLAQAQALASERALKETKEPEAALAAAARFAVNSDPAVNRPTIQLPKGVKPPSGTSPVPNKIPTSSSSPLINQSSIVTSNDKSSRASSSVSTPRKVGGRGGNGIDDFVPDTDEHINAFLSDAVSDPSGSRTLSRQDDSSDEETFKRGNPLVVSVEEDFDEELLNSVATIIVPDSILNANDSSDEESEEVIHHARTSPTPTGGTENTGASKLGFNLFVGERNDTKNNSGSSLEESEQPSSLESGGKKSSKKSSQPKKSSKNKHKKSSKKDNTHHHMDLEEFLTGDTSKQTAKVDTSAYEAL